jgi:phage gpG-like protein
MIQYRTNLKWNGPIVLSRINREIKQAVRQGAERVRRAAKDPLLNKSGKSMTARAGLNKAKTPVGRWYHGVGNLTGLNIVNFGKSSMAAGGSLAAGKLKNQTTIDRVYWYGEPLHRWVQSSVPGTPPHKQTGHLQRSIAVEIVNDGLRAKIGPGQGLRYARIQELGGRTRFGTLPPRPYMAPALTMTQSAIVQDFFRAIARATK